MPTPLYDALKEYAQKNPARFHMPGHKGKFLPAPELAGLAPIDLTELLPTGNLYEAGEPFDSAQRLWAELFGFDFCQFLTGGSTMGIHTGLALCAGPGEKALVDRGCHRAVFNALALLDLEPVWLERPWLDSENMIGPISPGQVEKMLDQHSDIKTVCITSPTYAGVLSDVEAISQIVHARGGTLFVDGAHGAHLPFLGVDPFRGADAAAVSAHKTLPAMGQSALLFVNGMDPDRVRRTASIFGSSSPSYPMLASMDLARDWLLGKGRWEYRRTACRVFEFRQAFPSLKDGPLPPHPEGEGRPRLCPGAGGAGNLPGDGGWGTCGADLLRPGQRRRSVPPGGGSGRAAGADGGVRAHLRAPSPGAGELPTGRPVCPRCAADVKGLRGGGFRLSDCPLPPRRARCGPRGADYKKRTGLFRENRV